MTFEYQEIFKSMLVFLQLYYSIDIVTSILLKNSVEAR